MDVAVPARLPVETYRFHSRRNSFGWTHDGRRSCRPDRSEAAWPIPAPAVASSPPPPHRPVGITPSALLQGG